MIKKFLFGIFALTFLTFAALAQTPEQAILSAREQFSDIKTRSMELERMKRDAFKQAVANNYAPNFPAIKKDFEAIQKLNSSVLELIVAKTPLNLAAVAKFVGQINHHAARLQSNLFSAETESKKNSKDNQTDIAAPRELRTLLADLDKSVNRFVHSPVFQNLNVVNPSESLEAQKDLEKVISFSRAIKLQTKN